VVLSDKLIMPANLNQELLTAALEGLEVRKKRIEEQITEVRSLMRSSGSRSTESDAQTPEQPRRRVLSAAARKRIAAAQRKRWAATKKAAAEQNTAKQPTASKKVATTKTAKKAAKKAAAKKAVVKKAAAKAPAGEAQE
jgi:hypothetical protein